MWFWGGGSDSTLLLAYEDEDNSAIQRPTNERDTVKTVWWETGSVKTLLWNSTCIVQVPLVSGDNPHINHLMAAAWLNSPCIR